MTMTIDIPDDAVAFEYKFVVRTGECGKCGEPLYREEGVKSRDLDDYSQYVISNLALGGRVHGC